jgi:hypothetical protein
MSPQPHLVTPALRIQQLPGPAGAGGRILGKRRAKCDAALEEAIGRRGAGAR